MFESSSLILNISHYTFYIALLGYGSKKKVHSFPIYKQRFPGLFILAALQESLLFMAKDKTLVPLIYVDNLETKRICQHQQNTKQENV